jgi:hypothetical protein
MCNTQETKNYSKSWCDLFVNDSIPDDDSERMVLPMADENLEADQQSLHSDHFAANVATIEEILFDSNSLSSPDCNQSVFSTGFVLEDFYSGPASLDAETNEFEHESNMQQVHSITVPDDQRMKEFYDSTEPVDWNHVLNSILN